MGSEDVCDLLGHRWVQPEGPFTRRLCARCDQLPHMVERAHMLNRGRFGSKEADRG